MSEPATLDDFPTLRAIALMVATSPVDKLKRDRFVVPVEMFRSGFVEAKEWCRRSSNRLLFAGEIDQQNFVWHGIPIVADIGEPLATVVAPSAQNVPAPQGTS